MRLVQRPTFLFLGFVIALVACGDTDETMTQSIGDEVTNAATGMGGASGESNEGVDTSEDDEVGFDAMDDGDNEDMFERTWCRTLSYSTSSASDGMTTERTTQCSWSGRVQTCTDGMTTTITEYNEFNAPTSVDTNTGDYSARTVFTYDCQENFCRTMSTETTSTVNDMTSISLSTCSWIGNTQTCTNSEASTTTTVEYNEYGYAILIGTETETYTSRFETEYDCSDAWCRVTATSSETTTDGVTTRTSTSCDWSDNTQTCNDETGQTTTVSEYNEYGYILSFTNTTPTFRSVTEYTYECE